jgi:uncharacterized membrane protein YidH (DUF202 family)
VTIVNSRTPRRKSSTDAARSGRVHLLTLLGGLIVFVTFVTKEGVVEHWKDTVSAVDSAEYRFRANSSSTALLRHVLGNANTLERIEDKINEHTDQSHVRLEEEHINEGANYDQLMLVSELLKKLPFSPEDDTRVRQLLAEGVRMNDAINAVATTLEGSGNGPPDVVELASEMTPLTLAGMSFEAHVAAFVKAIRIKAAEEKEKDEKRLNFATWASYCLYTLGWGLGIAAKLFGAEGAAEVE